MSEQMVGQVDAFTQGYDKGFADGMRVGYERGIKQGNDLLRQHLELREQERLFIDGRDSEQ